MRFPLGFREGASVFLPWTEAPGNIPQGSVRPGPEGRLCLSHFREPRKLGLLTSEPVLRGRLWVPVTLAPFVSSANRSASTHVNPGNTLRHPRLGCAGLFINGVSYFHRFTSQALRGPLPRGWLRARCRRHQKSQTGTSSWGSRLAWGVQK